MFFNGYIRDLYLLLGTFLLTSECLIILGCACFELFPSTALGSLFLFGIPLLLFSLVHNLIEQFSPNLRNTLHPGLRVCMAEVQNRYKTSSADVFEHRHIELTAITYIAALCEKTSFLKVESLHELINSLSAPVVAFEGVAMDESWTVPGDSDSPCALSPHTLLVFAGHHLFREVALTEIEVLAVFTNKQGVKHGLGLLIYFIKVIPVYKSSSLSGVSMQIEIEIKL